MEYTKDELLVLNDYIQIVHIIGKKHDTKENFILVYKERIKEFDEEKINSLWETYNGQHTEDNKSIEIYNEKSVELFNEKTNNFFKETNVRENNSIPQNVMLEITFKEDIGIPKLCPYKNKKESGQSMKYVIKAIIKYTPDASNQLCGIEYPLSIPKNGMIGLLNYLHATGKSPQLKEKTFTVITKNRVTYIWNEITSR